MACQDYDVTVDIVVCITDDGTLQVFWRIGGAGGGGYEKVIDESGWDGSSTSDKITDNQICENATDGGDNLSGPGVVTLGARSIGTDDDGNEIVQVSWEIGCNGSCASSGSKKIVVTEGAACPV